MDVITPLSTASAGHYMSATSCAIMFIVAFGIDFFGVGTTAWVDRIACPIAIACVYEGFNGSTWDARLVKALGSPIDRAKIWSGDAYIADADTKKVIGALTFFVAVYLFGCLAPQSWSGRMGGFTKFVFKTKARINWKMWIGSILFALLSDLNGGLVGFVTNGFIKFDVVLVSIMPSIWFGA